MGDSRDLVISAEALGMESCVHGMGPAWCYLCRVDGSGLDPRTAWGLDLTGDEGSTWGSRVGRMAPMQAEYLQFLCEEFGEAFDSTLSEDEAAIVIDDVAHEPMSESQARTLAWLCERAGEETPNELTYGEARAQIRRLVAVRGVRSA